MKTFLLLTLMIAAGRLIAAPGEVWHIPAGTENAIGTTMRAPLYEVKDSDVVIYQGFWKNGGANGNQTGGTVHYRLTPNGGAAGSWQTVDLSYEADEGTNQYWKATLPSTAIDPSDVIEYYVAVRFADAAPETTYLYGGDLDGHNLKTVNEATAQTTPYSIRNRCGWIYHANDSTISGNNISIALKTGYIGPNNDPATRWANQGAIYYTTDGSTPTGSFGAGAGTTSVTTLSYDGVVSDNSGNGNAAIWRGTLIDVLDGLPLGSEVKYKLALWNTATNEEKFADHAAGTDNATFTYQNGAIGEPSLTINGLNANYTTTKHFIDEIAGDSVNLTIVFESGEANTTEAEIYTNLNRRDRADEDANGDGYDDGISGLDGNSLVAGDDTYYYKAYTMTAAGAGIYHLTLPANKTGVYRLTARWKVTGDPTWRWYTNDSANRRDHAITLSPVDARHINLYEINVFNIEASGATFAERSTLEDLHNAAGAAHNTNNRWDLDYLTDLGCNWLWFQPIHPNGIDGRENDPATGNPYQPGSPYAVKNFFEVNELMSIHYNEVNSNAVNRAASMTAFQNFVTAADTKDVGIMLDSPFNHTSFDVELAQAGVDLFQPDGSTWSTTDEIRARDARFFSLQGNYGTRATSAETIASGPDRFDFGKWNDVKDVFFGRYDALVETDSEPERSSYTNEGDWFDTTDPNWTAIDFVNNGQSRNTTRQVWKYFAAYATHWLEQTRPAGQNRNSSSEAGLTVEQRYAWDAAGIDGLRCDFGQGLPSRAWEYMINVARETKWNFVMMSESLDGGAVTYRSNRNFDILNENIVFPLKTATNKYAYRDIFNTRSNLYGQALVLMNTASHDEENYDDPWQAVARIAVTATNEGVTMVFPGQEQGITRNYGYSQYETNFGKQVAHFKKWNSMKPIWDDDNFGNDQLYPVLSAILSARNNSPALTSNNRWFLDGDGNNSQIHAVAKYNTANASPATDDVVIAFTNLDRDNTQSDQFKIPVELAPLLGLQDDRTYNVKNIAAYLNDSIGMNGRRANWLWSNGITGANLKSSGFFVSLNKVPTQNTGTDPGNPNEPAWDEQPYEAQYLKVYDVTPPSATPSTPMMPNNYDYEIGTQATFDWADVAADSAGIVPHYEVTVTINNGTPTPYITTVSQFTVNASEGNQVAISVRTVNPYATENTGPTSSQSQAIKLLPALGDEDNDGIPNADEKAAGTNPRDNHSKLEMTDHSINPSNQFTLSWFGVSNIYYGVESKLNLTAINWNSEAAGIIGSNAIITWIDPEAMEPEITTNKFYRVIVE